jgi:hypothetical protein
VAVDVGTIDQNGAYACVDRHSGIITARSSRGNQWFKLVNASLASDCHDTPMVSDPPFDVSDMKVDTDQYGSPGSGNVPLFFLNEKYGF